MTRRTYRLWAPGVVFAAVGLLVLWLGPLPGFGFRGGVAIAGLYALICQVVLSLFVVASVDDFGDRRGAASRQSFGAVLIGQRDASLHRLTFSRALTQFYLQSTVAMGLFSFGLGASLSAIIDGQLSPSNFTPLGASHPSEFLLAVALLAGAIFLAVAGARVGYVGGYLGWCIGFALAVVLGQDQFIANTDRGSTLLGWGLIVVGLCFSRAVLWALMKVIGWLRQRSRPAPAAP